MNEYGGMGGSLRREKENDSGGDGLRTVREGSFILGGQAGGIYTTAYHEVILDRNGKTSRKREFMGHGITNPIGSTPFN